MKQLKILINASLSNSLINFRGHLIKAMVDAGHRVICTAPDAKARERLLLLGAELITVPMSRSGFNPIKDLAYLSKLHQIMQQIKPGIVLSYTIKPVIYGSVAARLNRVKDVYSLITGLGYAFMNNTSRQRLTGLIAKSLYRVALKNNNKVFFQNPDDMEEFLSYKIVTNEQSFLVNGSGVDLNQFKFHPVKTEKLSFLLVARLLKEKGIIEFLEAASTVKQYRPDVQFDLVGPEDPSPSGLKIDDIKRFIDLGVVNYHGSKDNVIPYMKQTSVYVLSSYREGTPRTVLEAMATGRPIITTDAPGCRETVINGENGFLIPVKDPNAIAKAMQKFIEKPSLIEKMGKASRQIAESKYDVHKVNKYLLTRMKLV